MLRTILPALALALAAAAPQEPKKPTASETNKLVDRYFEAPEEERAQIRARLDLLDPLSPSSVKTWSKKLLKLAAKGPTSEEKSRNYLYDEKEKKGLYLLGGSRPGKGGLFVGLHGGGAGSGDAGSSHGWMSGPIGSMGWIGVFPEVLEKTEHGWTEEPTERFVLDLIETMKRTYKIDTNRIYLGGHSMGGFGTWMLGSRHADLFAGLVATAGAATPYRDPRDGKTPVGIVEGVLPCLRNVPLWIYHSRDDPRVDFPTNELAVAGLKELQAKHGGYVHRFDAVDGRGHDTPDLGPPFEFVAKHPRDPRPKKVVWQPSRPWKRMFYWLWWDRPILASVLVAEVAAPNRIEITVEETKDRPVEGLSVLLDERLVDLRKEVVILLNGTERFRGTVAPSLSTMLLTAAERNDPEMLFGVRVEL